MTLADIKEGEHATVKKITGNKVIKQRLEEMGLIHGTEIKVERFAPFGDPMQIKVKGFMLAIRLLEGRMVEVDKS